MRNPGIRKSRRSRHIEHSTLTRQDVDPRVESVVEIALDTSRENPGHHGRADRAHPEQLQPDARQFACQVISAAIAVQLRQLVS